MNFQHGDIIERPGPFLTMHRGVFIGFDVWGRAWVIHNAKDGYVQQDLLEVFAVGQPVSLASRTARNWYQRQQIVARAQSLLGQKFDLLNFNCDHLVTYAQSGVAVSPQLRTFAALLGVAALCGLAISSSTS